MTAVFSQDIMLEILLILPPKTLMRFKCVCKGWYSLINNPWFIAKHLSLFNSKYPNIKHLLVMKKGLILHNIHIDELYKVQEEEKEEVIFSLLDLCNNDGGVEAGDQDRITVSSVEDMRLPHSMTRRRRGEAVHMVAHCNGIICLVVQTQQERVILWNPSIQDFKLLPLSPYLTEPLCCWSSVPDVQGFGYDAKLNEYIFVGFYLNSGWNIRVDYYDACSRPSAAIYSLTTDSWKMINTIPLETESTYFWPDSFQIQFKEMFYWLGHEHHKDFDEWNTDLGDPKQVIISLDIQNEVFYDILLPDCLYKTVYALRMSLQVQNESLALFCLVREFLGAEESFAVWVMDELGGPTGAYWTKQVTLEPIVKPLGFLNSNGIFLDDFLGFLCSYELGRKRTEEEICRQSSPYSVPPQDYDSLSVVAYGKSIVTVSGSAHKLDIRDDSILANLSPLPNFPPSSSKVDRECHSYSVWAMPPYDVSLRIKKVMESLRTEFGGPEIEPHIPIVVYIRMSYEDVLENFTSLSSKNLRSFQAKIKVLDTGDFYYQRLCLRIDISEEAFRKFDDTICISNGQFRSHLEGRPCLSLLYGNRLTEEEKEVAVQKVSRLDETVSSMSFTVSQLALYKINYKDTTLQSWKKIVEYDLPLP